MSKRSEIWNHFDVIESGKARCNLCHFELSITGGSTGSLWKHVKSRHTHLTLAKLQSSSSTESAEPSSRPMTVPGMFTKTNITTARSDKITDLVVRMIAKDTLSINFVEGTGFRELMAYVEPAYVVPCAKTVKKQLSNLYSKVKDKIRIMLNDEASFVALTTDCWTSGATDSYITLTAHYACARSFSMVSYVLTTQEIEGRHTGLHIKDTLKGIMREWGIEDKSSTVVHDNAANMLCASA